MHAVRFAPIAVSAALLAAQAAPALSATGPGRKLFPCVTSVPGSQSVGLTFDDGPDHCLDHFLRALDELDARATFFLIGEQVERWPSAPAEIISAGHEVAVHGYTHRGHLRRTPWEVADDLRRARAIIEDASGCETRFYRAPYGLFSLGSWQEAAAQGWTNVLWSRWGRDWEKQATPQLIANRIGDPAPGDVLLLHDSDRYGAENSWRNTLGSLPIIVERLGNRGLRATSLTALIQEAGGMSPSGESA